MNHEIIHRRGRRRREPIPAPELRRLLGEALQSAWDPATQRAYQSHLNSYLDFIELHNLDPEPSPLTLALYIVFMSQSIKPTSVESYLTGITHYLSAVYPCIRHNRASQLVTQTLKGCKKRYNTPTVRKRPLKLSELEHVANAYSSRHLHDDNLFLAQLIVGFFGLLRLGELVYPNDSSLDCPRKMILRSSLHVNNSELSFNLPYNKSDRFFEGNTVRILANPTTTNPITAVRQYLESRDILFPNSPDLWIMENGNRPRRNWFITRLREFFDNSIGGHSLRAGGATALAEDGVPFELIQGVGRWSSDTFRIYIRQHPIILHSIINQNKA